MKTYGQSALAGLAAGLLLLVSVEAQGSTIYLDGVSPPLSGVFDLGTHLPGYIGSTTCDGTCNGTALDGGRVYLYDLGPGNTPSSTPFNLLVWQFASAKDSVRLYTHQDHYSGGPVDDSLAPEVLEYSVFGCNGVTGGCKNQSDWTLLSDPIGWTFPTVGNPEYTFAGLSPAATIFRGGSAEFGLGNAYVQDFTFSTSYNFFGVRGSTIAMNANTADPELDAVASFNRVNVPVDPTAVPEPAPLILLGSGLLAVFGCVRRKRG